MQTVYDVYKFTDKSDEMYLNCCGSAGEGYKSASSLIFNGWTGGLQQVVDAADKPGAFRGVGMANLAGRDKSSKS